MSLHDFTASAQDHGSRVDVTVARHVTGCTLGAAKKLCASRRVVVNGQKAAKGDVVKLGDRVVVDLGQKNTDNRQPTPDIIFANNNVVVVNKPAGLPCHPLTPVAEATCLSAVCAAYPDVATASANPLEGGLCHRLDTATSGCLLFARSHDVHAQIRSQFRRGSVKKTYVALLAGVLRAPTEVGLAIAHDASDPRKMVGAQAGSNYRGEPKPATTSFWPLSCDGHQTLVVAATCQGRRHQIRVHAQCLGAPLLGDALYGSASPMMPKGHALHAWTLTVPDIETCVATPPTWVDARLLEAWRRQSRPT